MNETFGSGASQGMSGESKPGIVRRFFRGLFKFLYGYFALIGFSVTVLPIILVLVLSRMAPDEYAPEHSGSVSSAQSKPHMLVLDLDGDLVEKSPDFESRFMARFFSHREMIFLPELRATLRDAAKDENVKGLFVRFGSLSAGEAQFSELRRMLAEFRDTGRVIHVWTPSLGLPELFVGSVASQISGPPSMDVTLLGPTFQLVYFGDALRKLGFEVEVIRHGKFKSAFEPFIMNRPSPETIENYTATERSMLEFYVKTIADSLKRSEADVAGWLVRSIWSSAQAREAGMIQAFAYSGEAEAAAKAAMGVEDTVHTSDWTAQSKSPAVSDNEALALIEAFGEIHMEPTGGGDDEITVDEIIEEIEWARDEPKAKAVVLRISSPGGSALASDLIWERLSSLAETKPLIVSMGDVAASGGYYIAAPAAQIFAEPSTITGSIGVIGMLPKCKECGSKYGVNFHVISSSARAKLLNFGESSTAEDKKIVGDMIDATYQLFLERVAKGRKMEVPAVDAVAQGRIYSGIEAKGLGLVDQVGGIRDAFQAAKTLGGLDPNKLYSILRYTPDHMSLSKCLKSVSDMFRCLQELEKDSRSAAARIMRGVGESRLSREEKALERTRSLLESFAEEPVQARWVQGSITPKI
jgi:protease-4